MYKFPLGFTAETIAELLSLCGRNKWKVIKELEPDLTKCPKCGGIADNGHDRCIPPNPYYCTKCMKAFSGKHEFIGLHEITKEKDTRHD